MDCFGGFGCARTLLGCVFVGGCQLRLGNAINDDFAAPLIVVAGITDVEVRTIRLWAGAGGDVFPVAIRCAGDAERTERLAAGVEGVDEWTITGVVMRPVRAG